MVACAYLVPSFQVDHLAGDRLPSCLVVGEDGLRGISSSKSFTAIRSLGICCGVDSSFCCCLSVAASANAPATRFSSLEGRRAGMWTLLERLDAAAWLLLPAIATFFFRTERFNSWIFARAEFILKFNEMESVYRLRMLVHGFVAVHYQW